MSSGLTMKANPEKMRKELLMGGGSSEKKESGSDSGEKSKGSVGREEPADLQKLLSVTSSVASKHM